MLERANIKGKEFLVGYHTQEFRVDGALTEPIRCRAKDAWLGVGYYFWTDLEYAKYWGIDRKKATGYYDVYRALLDIDNCINAAFDEEGYFFFRERIEETIEHFRKNGLEISLEKVTRFLSDEVWPQLKIQGVIYDDKPENSKAGRMQSEIPPLYYKKRIQVVIFHLKNIRNFALYLEEQE